MALNKIFASAVASLCLIVAVPAMAGANDPQAPLAYTPISYDAASETITLTGRDMTIEQLVRIARHGAKVSLTAEARKRSADAYGLLLQAAAEGVSVYWFNRGAGAQRETVIFSGDPTTPENTALLKARQLASFARGEGSSYGPEVAREDIVRAMMAIRANAMSYEAASPQLTQMLVDMINAGITPVVGSAGTLGEGDLAQLADIGRAMVGKGYVYYKGKRVAASEALSAAGLKPLEPFGADDAALVSTNAYFTAQTALLVADTENLLNWMDIDTAMALLGMNSSVSPLSMPVQSNRPFPWLNWDARRVLDMVKGSYLLDADPKRIIQDPESLRATTQRTGSAWQSWAEVRDSVLIAMNSSDHNPAVRPGLKPTDSWELATPQMMKFHVKGGKLSGGQGGYIFSNANWDPYPLSNQVEGLTIAIANMGLVLTQRIERFTNPFFTVIRPSDVMTPEQISALPFAGGYLPADIWIEITGLINPVVPQGQPIVMTVEDLQAETRLKVARARQAVDLTTHLLAQDIITSTNWMEVRKVQDPARKFGTVPTAALAGLRSVIPLGNSGGRGYTASRSVVDYIQATPATRFLSGATPMPATMPLPVAQKH
ncbi:histidine ammonia-lyase [Sphingomonas zeicaulis]|uniref:aromatic amino acid ammonia-lyase n=1 Tax=Sphingomonas zeicaulis TaxID=1632740 RepID=UPI003D243458